MLKDLKGKWDNLRPDTRQKASIAVIAAILLIVGGVFWVITGGNGSSKSGAPVQLAEQKRNITIDPKLMEKTMAARTDEQSQKMAEMQRQIDEMRKMTGQAVPDPMAMNGQNTGAFNALGPNATPSQKLAYGMSMVDSNNRPKSFRPPTTMPSLPAQQNLPQPTFNGAGAGAIPPPPLAAPSSIPAGQPGMPPVVSAPREIFGAIATSGDASAWSNRPGQGKEEQKSEAKSTASPQSKKKGSRAGGEAREDIYLPPSFMEATLLNGMYAPTSEAAKGNPIPCMIRIRDMAQLPNSVKSDLRGCFVMGEAIGSLADERAHVRLTSLSCISKNGESIIDQPITGYVSDADGTIGLSGVPISKMGQTITRAALAGFMSGIGKAMEQSSTAQTTTVGTLGVTSLLSNNLSDLATAGLGSGISQAANELSRFYLELARAQIPTIYVGAAKRITVVVKQGVTLKIKDYKKPGRKHRS